MKLKRFRRKKKLKYILSKELIEDILREQLGVDKE